MTTTNSRFLFFIAVAVALLCLNISETRAQLSVSQVAFPGGTPLDVSAYPTVRAQVRITLNGQPAEVPASEFSIVETNTAYAPASVTYSGNGIHVIQWIPIRFGFLQCSMFASMNGLTGSTSFFANVGKSKGAQVTVQDSMSRILPKFVDFGNVAPGATDTIKLKIVATEAALAGDPQQERPILLESVTTSRPEFKVIWKGSFGSGPLPTNIISPLEYRIDLVCTPTSNAPLYDVLTVTFEGGMRTTVMIIANPPTYPRRTILALASPNGSETFAPCQEIPITWSGAVKGFHSHVEVTTNNGRTWQYIDSTMDTSIKWQVPDSYSDSVRVRVFQKFEASQSLWLVGETVPVTNIAYSLDGRYLLAAYTNGTIIEWDVVTATKTNTYAVSNMSGSQVRGLAYIGNSQAFVALVNRENAKGGVLQKFQPGSVAAVVTGAVPADLTIGDVASSIDGSSVFLMPQFAARIPLFSTTTLEQTADVVLPGTASSTTMNGTSIAAVLLNGEVVTFDVATRLETKRVQTGLAEGLGPYGRSIASSVTGRLVAIAGPTLTGVQNGPKEQRTFIYDMQKNEVVKIIFREGSNVVNLGFSPSDAFLGLGFEFNPQFVVYDLATARTLPPSGSSAGHMNKLTDIAFGPDAASVATSSSDSTNNLLLRRVSVPESDASDNVFSISPVSLSINPIVLNKLLIATQSDTVVTANVCNIGKNIAVFSSVKARNGSWLSVTAPASTDTVLPGACLRLSLHAFVRDTGMLTDTIEMYSCGVRFVVPVSIHVDDRNLTVVNPQVDFGDLCVGAATKKHIQLLRNNDSVPITISNVYVQGGLTSAFRVATRITDTVLAPGATLAVDVEYSPTTLGNDTGIVIVRYENLDAVQRTMIVTGHGSGADLTVSHLALPFIPEIPERTITITNNSNNEVHLTAASITAGTPFEVITSMPQTLLPGSTIDIAIRYLGAEFDSVALLQFSAEPCAAQTQIQLLVYHGTTTITPATVTADPRSDTTSIPIIADITESVPYKGQRSYQGLLRVDPELYLAKTITTTIGTANIVSQHIVNGWREIVFTIEGTFEGDGEIARLIGYAGMSGRDSSRLWFDSTASGFGKAVEVDYAEGMLRIVYPDPARRVIHNTPPFIIRALAPMPANESTTVSLLVEQNQLLVLRIVDANGIILKQISVSVQPGIVEYEIPTSDLQSGSYNLEIIAGTVSKHKQLVVVR